MDPVLRAWVQRHSHEEQNGDFATFVLRPRTVHEDKMNKVRILAIGPENNLEEKIVLLLGERGAGKTHFLNALLNRTFGVQLEDGLRLQLSDQIDYKMGKTEYITVYTFYHQEGMPHYYNYTIIDTPGLVSTNGASVDEVSEQCLRSYLFRDGSVKHLNSVALAWKGTDSRLSRVKREMLAKIKTLLGRDMKSITDIVMTHASRINENALKMLNEGQFEYRNVFWCDSGCLYDTMEDEADTEEQEGNWKRMTRPLDNFLTALNQREPVSLKITKDLLQKMAQLAHVKAVLVNLGSYRTDLGKELETYQRELDRVKQQALTVAWDKVSELDKSSREIHLDDGKHCHHCSRCQKVCNASCSSNHERSRWPSYERDGYVKWLITMAANPFKNRTPRILTVILTGIVTGVTQGIIPGIITGALVLGIALIFTYKSSELTRKLHEMEGHNKCPDCSHRGFEHSVRDKFLVKDATFNVQMELLRLEKFGQVMGPKANFEAKVNECLEEMKKIDRKVFEEEHRQMALETDIKRLM